MVHCGGARGTMQLVSSGYNSSKENTKIIRKKTAGEFVEV